MNLVPNDPRYLETCPDSELARVLVRIWADVEFRAALSGTTEFVRERLVFFGRRGYFTAAERQGILRVLFTGAVPIAQRIASIQNRRAQMVVVVN